ncbi:uncharacterized protein [Physcomitrium patens]|uniref:Glycosyltransferase 2-like domain-containing protein n=1 Tax=Physcomitrium patens TaxID=3218 RepID=A0A2K1KTG8_PHYPA|nr:uncharacterized protein LOC112280154 [Physcomitrium patens]XP_024371048.1 uncharacterized protein LOC112280154 [Physcomitrium patens]XP_024371050.1 uncharacterized protein LOC112280154 [Physcomitrium patens]PNR57072.1 hypothetical protein PHYPA_004065 [Physcomitrium patens]|eukprot:XP_024371047.1 uncharacterized protein LOC112280154 [Physcomitrella patens]
MWQMKGDYDQKDSVFRDFKDVYKRKPTNRILSISAALTCLQCFFALYGTVLLFHMSPSVELMAASDGSTFWAGQIARQWKNWMTTAAYRASLNHLPPVPLAKSDVCEREEINFEQKKSTDKRMIGFKTSLFNEVMSFQQKSRGCETLDELMALPSSSAGAKVTVIVNHYQRKTLCAQLDALLEQTHPFHNLWVLAFGSPQQDQLRSIVETYNDSRITFVGSTYDFKYYGRFQLALQTVGADFVYMLDDDMIPGKRMIEIMAHIGATDKYRNSVLGSIGRILPFRQKDFTFPSYRKFGSKEAGIYLPDPAYNIVVDRIVQVDFLSSSWFISADLIRSLFIERPFTFVTGEDLHLSYLLQKYMNGGSYVVPVDPRNKETWGDSEHRLAYVSETTVIHKDIVQVRDNQWWRTMSRGYVTQWAAMNPQKSDVIFYADTLDEVRALAPLILKFRATPGKKAFVAVTGAPSCPCEEAATILGWSPASCHERRFKIFNFEIRGDSRDKTKLDPSFINEVFASMKGLMRIHGPSLIMTTNTIAPSVREALTLAVRTINATLVELPPSAVPYSLWIPDIRSVALHYWNNIKISISIITQTRPASLRRLLNSLTNAHYLGDKIGITFNMDSKVDSETLLAIHAFNWPHGPKTVKRRIIQGGLIRAVSESWYPASDDDFGLLLEDDIEVSPFYYMWLKYALLAYHYDPTVHLPELNAIALYTPRVVEVVKERPRWNGTDFFKMIHPNTPYLHQLPCSWGALFFPQRWREFYKYMGMRFTENPKDNLVQIPHSRTNGWQASWKKFLIDMMYLRGYVTLYPNFPNQTSFSTNHMEPGAHINASDNVVKHNREDFVVPLLYEDFQPLLPKQKLPPASKLPVLNLFNIPTTLKGLKSAGAKLGQDVLRCEKTAVVTVDPITGEPQKCSTF